MANENRGFIKLVRSKKTEELLFGDKNSFVLLSVIAYRARRTNGFNVKNLQVGEALLGDYKSYGLTEQKYRTAKKKLEKWKIATFRTTNKGTIAKLIDSSVYDINFDEDNEQSNRQVTDKQRASNGQATTNKNVRMQECKNARESDKPSLSEVSDFFVSEKLKSSPHVFWNYYEAHGWPNGDWQALAIVWESREKKADLKVCVVDQNEGCKYQIDNQGKKVWLCQKCLSAFKKSNHCNFGKLPVQEIEQLVLQGKSNS